MLQQLIIVTRSNLVYSSWSDKTYVNSCYIFSFSVQQRVTIIRRVQLDLKLDKMCTETKPAVPKYLNTCTSSIYTIFVYVQLVEKIIWAFYVFVDFHHEILESNNNTNIRACIWYVWWKSKRGYISYNIQENKCLESFMLVIILGHFQRFFCKFHLKFLEFGNIIRNNSQCTFF